MSDATRRNTHKCGSKCAWPTASGGKPWQCVRKLRWRVRVCATASCCRWRDGAPLWCKGEPATFLAVDLAGCRGLGRVCGRLWRAGVSVCLWRAWRSAGRSSRSEVQSHDRQAKAAGDRRQATKETRATATRQETWLILPGVICLPRRISHACVSMNRGSVKLRTAPYNSDDSHDGAYKDNRGNSAANTWRGNPAFAGGTRAASHGNWRTQQRCARHTNVWPINFRWYGRGVPWWRRVTGNWGSIPERGPERRPPRPRSATGANIFHCSTSEKVKGRGGESPRALNSKEGCVKTDPKTTGG